MQVAAIKADVSLKKAKPQDLRKSLGSFSLWMNSSNASLYLKEVSSLQNTIIQMQEKMK